VVGVDKSTDIAVLKIETKDPLPTVKLGNSDSMQIGDWVLAIGSPFGLQETVTAGIVSSKDRDIGGGVANQFQRFIQTDAAINPGNSGGPLLNMSGEVIGINTAIYTQSQGYQGVGFAMPSNTVADVYNQLIGPTHKVTRGWIGIAFQPTVSSATARVYGFKTGVLVSSVDPNGPAEKAGLRTGDVITTIDGRSIKGGDDLVADISSRHPGASVKLGYLRAGKAENTVLVVGDRDKGLAARSTVAGNDNPDNPADDTANAAKIGVTIRNVPPALATRMALKGGVQIMSVKPGSFADEIALPQGVVVTEINKKPVNNDQDFKSIVSGLKSGDDVVFVFHSPQDTQHGSSFAGGTLP
jgi:serine protease Do